MVSVTSARPSGARPVVPAKMTSSILPPRNAFAPCSPKTQAMASTTLDLPEPFGPTTQVMPGSSRNVVVDAKDLKPFAVKVLRCTALRSRSGRRDGAGGGSSSQATARRPPDPAATRRRRARVFDANRRPNPASLLTNPRRIHDLSRARQGLYLAVGQDRLHLCDSLPAPPSWEWATFSQLRRRNTG